MGPLGRIDPTVFKPDGLVAVHGEPLLGLPCESGHRMQRIGDTDQWLVESGLYLSRLEWDREGSEIRLREILNVLPEWCLSADGKRLFAMRRSQDGWKRASECFDMASSQSLWTAPKDIEPLDAIFSLDGTAIIVLHGQRGPSKDLLPLVSWLDANTGELRRQVKLTGEMTGGMTLSNFLAESHRALYVAVPQKDDSFQGWCLPAAGGDPVRLEWDPTPSQGATTVRMGGEHLDLLTVTTEEVFELFRESGSGPPVRLCREDVSLDSPDSSDKNVRFSPDHRQVLVADCLKTVRISIPANDEETPKIERIKGGTSLGDFTRDGKYFVCVDDGGGSLHDPETLQRIDKTKLREFPAHCCPIEDAGFSIGDRWIISNDKHSLLLWTREGDILAELASPNEVSKPRIEMQSPRIVDRLEKVYASDGWNFLEWDLKEVAERRKKFPGFQPRIVGKVVFNDLHAGSDGPDTMALSMDASGKKLITAMGRTVIYRPLDEPEKTTRLPLANHDVFSRGPDFWIPEAGGEILLNASGVLLALDPEGKKVPRVLSTSCTTASPAGLSFNAFGGGEGLAITAKAFGAEGLGDDRMIGPPGWRWTDSRTLRVTPDNRYLVAALKTKGLDHPGILAVIDWKQKKLIREVPLPWQATTVELSTDGARLLVGAYNRSIYEFDLKQLCTAP